MAKQLRRVVAGQCEPTRDGLSKLLDSLQPGITGESVLPGVARAERQLAASGCCWTAATIAWNS